MAELDLWKGFMERDDVQQLDLHDQAALLMVALEVADLEPDLDGFLPRAAVRRVLWNLGPTDLVERLDGTLRDAGFVQRIDDPDGYLLSGWLDRVAYYRPGNATTAAIAWG